MTFIYIMDMNKIGLILGGVAVAVNAAAELPQLTYPVAERQDVVDDYFGTKVADPYRWLENDTSAQTAAWVAAQRELTDKYLEALPYRKQIAGELRNLLDMEQIGASTKKKGKYYYFYNSGLQNQSVLYVADKPGERGRVLLDPNTLSSEGTVALLGIEFSEDGKYMLYAVSRNGSDWEEIFVRDLATGKDLPDHIKWVKASITSWYKDGFFYSAYDAPADGKEYSNANENQKVYYHKLGTEQSDDQLVFSDERYPQRFFMAQPDEDSDLLFLYVEAAGNGQGLYVKSLKKQDAEFTCINDQFDYSCGVVGVVKNKIYMMTNLGAPKGRLVVADVKNPGSANWKTVLPETSDVLSSVQIVNGKLVAVYDKDASNHAYVYNLDGKLLHEVALPAVGTVSFNGSAKSKDVYYTFSSFVYPPTVYSYDIDKNVSTVYSQPKVNFKPEDYVTEQVFFSSKDGTKVPMTLTYKKGLKRDGSNPLWIYGYGGFNITLYPSYKARRMFMLENGFVYAQVNLRGGNEYGEDWHVAGTKMQKQNVFDDFIAAAEWCVDNGYTSKNRIVAEGGSNGGLLVGACVNQRPDLYRVAFPMVGVMDMLRYHKFTIGWNWAHDYGTSADSKEMFEYLKAYSPLHNIKNDGTRYPAIMVTTADHDDRVVPAHSFKYAAMLQASDTGDQPKLIRIESNAGHGGGMPTEKVIAEYADVYAFAMHILGLKPVVEE